MFNGTMSLFYLNYSFVSIATRKSSWGLSYINHYVGMVTIMLVKRLYFTVHGK